jgi:hypothetical protein
MKEKEKVIKERKESLAEEERELIEFGFKPVDDPEEIKKIEEGHRKIAEDVNPIMRILTE